MDRDEEPPNRTLHPGELYVARSPLLLQTILGSCVAVTFWSPRLGVGAMCHGVLPKWRKHFGEHNGPTEQHRYVDVCIRYLAHQFDLLGVERRDVEVKVFGGADVLPVITSRPTVGAQNCRAALEVLAQERFNVLASDLRGVAGRKITFDTRSGDVLVHKLEAYHA